jgi:hypothetical protein
MWGSLCIISILFAFFLIPETKGRSLEQVDRMLEEVSPRKSRFWVPHSTFAAEMGLVEKGIPFQAENMVIQLRRPRLRLKMFNLLKRLFKCVSRSDAGIASR